VQPTTVTSEAPAVPTFPFLDLRAQYRTIKAEVDQAIQRVMESQQFILGPEVEGFEREVAAYTGTQYAIGCASGSDALLLALMALAVGPGDEVVTTPFTFVATIGAIARLGARPVFVDIDPVSFNLDPKRLDRAITPRTKAIIPVHLFGLSADMDPIMDVANLRRVKVVEDAAQAIGATYAGRAVGSIGLCGCFSFFPSKNLGGAGDGGMLICQDPHFADRVRVLHSHGGRTKYEYEVVGVNSRLDALQAAILRVKLRHLNSWTEGRQRVAARYAERLGPLSEKGEIILPLSSPACRHIYNQYVVRVRERDRLQRHLRECGVPTDVYYPVPLHLQEGFRYLGYKDGDFPESEAASRDVLAVPVFPEISQQQQNLVTDSITGFYR